MFSKVPKQLELPIIFQQLLKILLVINSILLGEFQ
jgi:hypothetical protein